MQTNAELPQDLVSAHQVILALQAEDRRKSYLIERLQGQLKWLQRRLYGRRSEKLTTSERQLLLFEVKALESQLEEIQKGAETEPETQEPEKRPSRSYNRRSFPASLERIPDVIEPASKDLVCTNCQQERNYS